MKRIIGLFIIAGFLLNEHARADEGMWMLPLLEEVAMADMNNMGLELTADQIYNLNQSSIKDAIVVFGGGCTGEIVSENGLLFTNHHCGYEQIQQHSSVEHDYLKEGFWAMSLEEELPNPDLEVRFLESIEDVTDQIFSELTEGMSEENRQSVIRDQISKLSREAAEGGKYEVRIRSYYDDNAYYMSKYITYTDVRFVGAPPSSIGKFGYDSDNWTWPRHNGDFSVFRVYTAPDGSPAPYSAENIPLKPKHHLPISLNGVEEGSFALVLGFPGRTNRYLSSFGIEETMNIVNTNRIKIRGERLAILMEDMELDPKVRIQYATKYSRSSNYWKYSIGQNKGLRRLKVIERKRKEEERFQEWVEQDSLRMAKYGDVLSGIEENYKARNPVQMNYNAMEEIFFSAIELVSFITNFQYLNFLLGYGDANPEDLRQEIEELKAETEKFFKDYHLPTDIKMARSMFELYPEMIGEARQPEIYSTINSRYRANYDKFVDRLYSKTFFTNKEEVLAFLNDPDRKQLEKDFAFQVTFSIFRKSLEEYRLLMNFDLNLDKYERLYMEGRMEMNPDNINYPDANFSMRLSYGTVEDYSPADAVHYDEMTFLKGVMQKEDSTLFEYLVPAKLKELYSKKDYGPYGIDGNMPVCFITTNDITGGNSGSPVMNERGELIGLAFDGNWEAMSGDIAFEPELQRCIVVDIRYVLFIIDKYAGATHLIDELKIAN